MVGDDDRRRQLIQQYFGPAARIRLLRETAAFGAPVFVVDYDRGTRHYRTLGSFGPVFGAIALLVFEELLPALIRLFGTPIFGEQAARASEYWQIVMGPLLLLVVLFARGGIDGLLCGTNRG